MPLSRSLLRVIPQQSFLTLADAPEASAESARALPVPTFEYVRFTGDEIGYRPIGIAGTYGQVNTGPHSIHC